VGAASGRVAGLWVAARAREPMAALRSARLMAGLGVDGDRYAVRRGTWSGYPPQEQQLTLIAREGLEAFALQAGEPLRPELTRRNVLTEGVALDELIGERFLVGTALCRGIKACEPCRHLERLTGRTLLRALAGRGGINAEVLEGGRVSVGSPVVPLPR
jgi:MOSC domain-containing protein YiiM